jgi:hypothetical protein
MSPDIWYELRVEGSAGTRDGIVRVATEGIAIAQSGRLCSIASGQTKRFNSEQEATHYLLYMTIPGNYRFEVVKCQGLQPAGSAPPNFVTTSSAGSGRLNR